MKWNKCCKDRETPIIYKGTVYARFEHVKKVQFRFQIMADKRIMRTITNDGLEKASKS